MLECFFANANANSSWQIYVKLSGLAHLTKESNTKKEKMRKKQPERRHEGTKGVKVCEKFSRYN